MIEENNIFYFQDFENEYEENNKFDKLIFDEEDSFINNDCIDIYNKSFNALIKKQTDYLFIKVHKKRKRINKNKFELNKRRKAYK